MNEIKRLHELAAEIPDVVELARKINVQRGLFRGAARGMGEDFVAAVKQHPGKAAAVAGVGAAVGYGVTAGGIHIHRQLKQQREFIRTAQEGEFMKIARDLYIDKHGAMFPANHPRVVDALNASGGREVRNVR